MLNRRYPPVKERKLIAIFSVAGIYFGLKVDYISEILQAGDIIRGDVGEDFLGFVDLKERRIPILDFRKYFGLGRNKETLGEKLGIKSLLVIKRDLEDSRENPKVGIIADRIEGVEEEENFSIFPFPETARNKATDIYQGLLMKMEDMILLLDVSCLIEKVSFRH